MRFSPSRQSTSLENMVQSILVTTGLSLVLYLTGFFVVFTPLPFMLCLLRRGVLPTVASFLLALLALLLLYQLPPAPLGFLPLMGFHPHLEFEQVTVLSLIYFFYFGWLGIAAASLSKRSDTIEKSFLGILLFCLIVPGLLAALYAGATSLDFIEEFQNSLEYFLGQMIAMQEKSGVAGDEVLFLRRYAPVIVSRVVEILPALAVNMTFVVAALNVVFFRRWGASGKPFSGWGDFSLWRLRERWVWFPIGAGSFYFLNLYLVRSDPFRVLLLNVLLILGVVYFFQGLAVVSFFFRRRFSPLLRMMAYLLILLFIQVFGIVIVVAGLFDFWFDFRKLKRVV